MISAKKPGRFRGRVEVYTGDGKGKTTAALGLALRAAGYGFRTYIGQFLKGQPSGELTSVRRLSPLLTIEQFGAKKFVHFAPSSGAAAKNKDVRRAEYGLERCRTAMLSKKYRIIVLDEINVALYFKLLSAKAVLEFLDQRPPDVEVILTGRRAPLSLVRRADLVTEMKSRKHYYERGVRAREGIER
jgi:cob(I)alamin adenosyltransferase